MDVLLNIDSGSNIRPNAVNIFPCAPNDRDLRFSSLSLDDDDDVRPLTNSSTDSAGGRAILIITRDVSPVVADGF